MHWWRIFSSELKHVDIVPVYKKKDKSDKTNYRPGGILFYCSKKYEKVLYNQVYQYFDNKFFPSQCKFKKRCSTQHCVSILIEKFEEAVEEAADMGNNFGALLTDSSKQLIALITIY